MEMKIIQKLSDFLKKYRYAICVVAIGLLLMLLPTGKKTNDTNATDILPEQTAESIEYRLSKILSKISGAGEVYVLLTESAGEKTLYQLDSDRNTDSQNESERISTVTVTDAQRNQSGLITQVLSPQYQGAIVVCEGAEDPSVRLAVVEAVSKVTGLGANHISVLKMN